MNTKITAIALSAIVIVCAIISHFNTVSSDDKQSHIELDNNVIIYSEETTVYQEIFDEYTIPSSDHPTTIPSNSIHIYDESWLSQNTTDSFIDGINNALSNNEPVIVKSDTNPFITSERIQIPLYAQTEGCDTHGMYVDINGKLHTYSNVGYDEVESIKKATIWASNTPSKVIDRSDNLTLNDEQSYWDSMGYSTVEFNISNIYEYCTTYEMSVLRNHSDPNNEFMTISVEQYTLSIGNYRISDIKYETGYQTHELISHEPASTSGVTETSFTADVNLVPSAPEFRRDTSWYYGDHETTIYNTSSMVNDTVNIWHDINERGNGGKSYTAKPGIMLSGSSIAIDSLELHKITYCEKTSELFGFVQAYRNFTENVLQVNLFSNGGHFQIMEPWT